MRSGTEPYHDRWIAGGGYLRRVIPSRAGDRERRRGGRGCTRLHTSGVDDERPPICPACGVTMVPAALSARETRGEVWICLECEESDDPDAV